MIYLLKMVFILICWDERTSLRKFLPFFGTKKEPFQMFWGISESPFGEIQHTSVHPNIRIRFTKLLMLVIGDFTTALTLRIVRDLLDATSICSPPPILKSAQDVITSYGCLEPSSVSSRILFLSTEDAPIESTLITDSIYVAFELKPLKRA